MTLRTILNRLISIGLCLALLAGMIPTALAAEQKYDGGKKEGFLQRIDQTDVVPEGYTGIYSASDLKALHNANKSGDYILMKDIDLGEWTPLCNDWPFKANLDGNGHTLTYKITCYVAKKSNWRLGLFSVVTGSVSNLHVKGTINITVESVSEGSCFAGGIAATVNDGGSVTNCVSDVAIRSDASLGSALRDEGVGGIAGAIGGASSIYFCRNRGGVTGYCGVGGIVGKAQFCSTGNATVFACLNEGEVQCGIKAGGIVGRMYKESRLMLQSCANTASVTAKETAGGIIGEGDRNTTVSDSLNTGNISSTQAPCYAGGIVGDGISVRYVRCVNTGTVKAVRSGSISGRIGSTDDVTYCYWLDTGKQEYCELGYSGVDSNDRTGARSAQSLKVKEDYKTYDFDKLWVIDNTLGCAYPLPLVWMDYDNTYKLSTEARKNERFERCFSLQSYLDSAGGPNGGAASILHKTYREAHLHIVNNGWKFIEQMNKITDLDFSADNSFELVMTDLLYQNYGLEVYEEMAAEKFLSSCSEFFTGMEAFMSYADAKEVQEIMTQMAKSGNAYAKSTGNLVNKMLALLDDNAVAKFAGSGAKITGSVYNLVSPGISSINNLKEEMNKYVLYNANADTSLAYAKLLREMNGHISGTSAGDTEKAWAKSALGSLSTQLSDAAKGDPSALYDKAGGEMLRFFSTEGKAAIGVFYGDLIEGIPVLAGAELGLKLGVPMANGLTKMDKVSYYGGMMDCAGILSEALYPVVLDRMSTFRAKGDYDSMAALKESMELYFALQLLACDYGIGYNNAIISSRLSIGFLTKDEKESTAKLQNYKQELEKTRNSVRNMLSEDSKLTGYVVMCPVSVHVTNKDGTAVALQTTGSQQVDDTVPECFQLLGEEAESKAGLYDENTQEMWITGDDSGTMDVLMYHITNGVYSGYEIYEDLPVTKGCTYTFENSDAILDGKQIFPPKERFYNPFADVKKGSFYYNAVLWALLQEPQITKGTDATHFSPNATCTRGQVVTFLWRAMGCPKPTGANNPFTDVKKGAFYYNAVLWALENKITNGMDATHFAPDKGCTRAQVVTFLWRAEKQPKPGNESNPFKDVKGGYYYNPVLWAVNQQITNGTDETHFSPDATCTRGQIVTFLYRDLKE